MEVKPEYRSIKVSASEIPAVMTSHNTGSKTVFFKGSDQPVMIRQIALGKLLNNEVVEPHVHPDMDEHYFVTAGDGWMRVDDKKFLLKSGDFILVAAGSEHELQCTGEPLEFYYQGFQILPGK